MSSPCGSQCTCQSVVSKQPCTASPRQLVDSTAPQTWWQQGVFELQEHTEVLTGPACGLIYIVRTRQSLFFLWVCVDTQTVQFYCRVFYNRHTTEKLEEWARLVMVSCHWWWWKSQSVVGAGLEIQNHSSQCIHVFGKGHGSKDWVFILNNFKFQWADHNSFAL